MNSSLLEIKDLKKSYKDKSVLKGIDFALQAGEIVAFLGPNGAGKSTTIKMIMGLRKPTAGKITVFGLDPDHTDVKNKIGYTSQELSFPAFLRVREILTFVKSHFVNPVEIDDMLSRFSLTHLQKVSAGGLSGGEKRRLGLACALIGRPQILILDEPTTGLDIESRAQLWLEIKKFKDQGGTVLLSTHDLNEVGAIADRVIVIDEGHLVVNGTVQEIKKRIEFQRISYVYQGEKIDELVQDSDQFVRRLVQEKPHFSQLEIHPVTLEEAFLNIRGKK